MSLADYILNHIEAIIIILVILTVLPVTFSYYRNRKAEKDPNNMAYYFKKYKLDTQADAFRVINDPKTPPEDKAKISAFYDFFNKLNAQ